MTEARQLRVFRWDYFLLAALSLSIGWGIRGNFGHEYGAMIPGCLTAIAVCLMSGRQDWRERAAYFAAFGALGWGFGGSISYMQVIAYSHSGVAESQLYGFAGLFLIGFLWAGMGGAGTAFPAVADREQLTAIFKPLCWIFALWLFKAWVVWPIAERWSTDYTATLNRHESPLYWFDADWTEAVTALIAVCLYDLYDRRFHKRVHPQVSLILGLVLAGFAIYLYFFIPVAADMHVLGIHFQFRGETFLMPFSYMRADLAMLAAILIALAFAVSVLYPLMLVFAGGGALLGQIAQQWIATKPELQDRLVGVLIHRQGDSEVYREVAGLTDKSLEEVSANFMLNWPQFFEEFHHYGLLFGAIIGAAIYFIWRGRFRDGASLFVYMSAGWLLSFILFPTILGLRLTPPRSDDWAGILGVFLGTNIWLIRNKLLPVAWAAWVSGILGGLAFAGAACLKLVMVYVGNPNRPQIGIASSNRATDSSTGWR
ncbi:MAG: hypothetical protein HYV26_06660 [Candidatus Hydrogenedentes bacterium]|nr:hypothetical protein [Candidatus Hydrogenedentota bacterium]